MLRRLQRAKYFAAGSIGNGRLLCTADRWRLRGRSTKIPGADLVSSDRTAGDGPNRRCVTLLRPQIGRARRRGVNETNKHCGAGLLPQSGRLPMGLPGPHARSGIHPIDRRRPLQRRLHDQLAVERVSGNSRTHLRPPLRAGLPARPRRERAGGDLPAEARRRRLQGRHPRPAAEACRQKNGKRIALVGGGPASLAVARDLAPLGYHCTVFDQDPKAGGMMRTQIPKFRLPDAVVDEETDYILNLGIEFKGGKRIDSMKTLLARELRRDLRRLRRAARPRARHSRPQGSRQEHPHRHRLAVQRLVRPHHQDRQARHRARRRQHRDGLLPHRAPPRRRGRQGDRALRLRGDEGVPLGKGRRHRTRTSRSSISWCRSPSPTTTAS